MSALQESTQYRIKVLALLILSSLFTIVMVKIRLDWTGTIHFRFLWLNLFLAWVPFLLASLAVAFNGLKKSWLIQLPIIGLWLLFFPNAMYIITDLLHIKTRMPIPLWFDVVMIFSAAWNGMILGYLSLKDIQKVFDKYVGPYVAGVVSILFLFLSGIGIYVGRFNRWNSWDVMHKPETIFGDLLHYAMYPSEHLWLYKFTLAMGLFLTAGYFLFHVLTERVQVRVIAR